MRTINIVTKAANELGHVAKAQRLCAARIVTAKTRLANLEAKAAALAQTAKEARERFDKLMQA